MVSIKLSILNAHFIHLSLGSNLNPMVGNTHVPDVPAIGRDGRPRPRPVFAGMEPVYGKFLGPVFTSMDEPLYPQEEHERKRFKLPFVFHHD